VVLGPWPPELQSLIERRHVLGLDLFDEVWEHEYHMAPAAHPWHGIVDRSLAVCLGPLAEARGLIGSGPFNLGSPDNYRVPDAGYHRGVPNTTFVATAAVVIEVVSPDDETFAKFTFYATHHVDEILVADPIARRIRCWHLRDVAYEEADQSELLGVRIHDLESGIAWPS
jgi:Uma2 family endonuclease